MLATVDDNVNYFSDIDPDDNFINQIYPGFGDRSSLYYSIDNMKNIIDVGDIVFLNLNIRSFVKNFDTFSAVLSAMDASPDVIVLTETWLNEPVDIDGYKSFHSFRCGRRSGGVSVFVRESFSAFKLDEFSVVDNTVESCVVKLSLVSLDLYIIAVYRPHSDTVVNFCNSLHALLSCNLFRRDVCLMGDLNVNLLDLDNSDTTHFSSMMRTFNYLPVITKPTRFPSSTLSQTASLLDHIWINFSTDYSNCAGIVLDNITDHCTTFLTLSRAILMRDSLSDLVEVKFRLVNDATIEKFGDMISTINWDVLIDCNDANIATAYFFKNCK